MQARVDPHLESVLRRIDLSETESSERRPFGSSVSRRGLISAAVHVLCFLRFFEECRAARSGGSRDSLQPAASKLDGKKVGDELLFYIDNKGEDEHKDEEDEKVNRSTNAAHTMTSSEKRGRKRKGKNAEKKEKIKLDSSQYDGTVWLSNFT
ncbi:hypothetical protein TB2_017573 [Malus domestica]